MEQNSIQKLDLIGLFNYYVATLEVIYKFQAEAIKHLKQLLNDLTIQSLEMKDSK
jgi:hypothetical protein